MYLLREQGATHVGCATDRVIESFRNDLYPGYKTSAGMPPELLDQFPIAEAAIEALGVVLWPMVEFEADDAIAAAADRFAADPRVERILICTPDKDMAQLVRDERIVLWDRRRELTYDDAGVRAKWGVPPEIVPDRLALVGDAADGYPGLPGWGDKTAAAVLARYGHFEQIPEKGSEWDVAGVRGPRRARDDLRDRMAEALLYRDLARLRTTADGVPIPSRTSTSSSGTAPTARAGGVLRRWGLDRSDRGRTAGSARADRPGRRPRPRPTSRERSSSSAWCAAGAATIPNAGSPAPRRTRARRRHR